ncbi:MAG TPA: amidohydrolase [Bacteroidales bacterium]|nr:amidohydrolase [Bacteroidales bacterium]
MQDLNIALIQTHLHWEDAAANRLHFETLMSRLKNHNDLIVLPETFTTGFPVDPAVFAEDPGGPGMQWMQRMAVQHQVVICGSLLIRQQGVSNNCLVWMRPDGSFETYAKRHVFRMGGEHRSISPGNKVLTVELKGWKVRPMICYDLRFPVWSRNRLGAAGFDYDLLLYVANWPEQRNWPWKQLLIARAIENQSYVIGLNRVGTDGLGNHYSGDSVVLDAKGLKIAAAKASAESIVETSLKASELLIFREKFNVSLDWDDYNILHLPPES